MSHFGDVVRPIHCGAGSDTSDSIDTVGDLNLETPPNGMWLA